MLSKIILFLVAIIPVAILLLYVNGKDKNKEPLGLLIKLFLGGIGSCFLVLIVSSLIRPYFPFMNIDISKPNSFLDVFLYSFIGVALIEELCKFIMTYNIGYKHEKFDEIYDIVLYSVFVALGFACFENILYVMQSGIKVGISRALLAVPGHACDGLFMGYYMCLAKIYSLKNNKSKEREYIIKGISASVVLHGIYDFCCFIGGKYTIIIFLLFVVVMYIAAIKKLNFMAKNNRNLINNKKINEEQIIKKIETNKNYEQINNKEGIEINNQNTSNIEKKQTEYFTFNENNEHSNYKSTNSDNFTFKDTLMPNTETINNNFTNKNNKPSNESNTN